MPTLRRILNPVQMVDQACPADTATYVPENSPRNPSKFSPQERAFTSKDKGRVEQTGQQDTLTRKSRYHPRLTLSPRHFQSSSQLLHPSQHVVQPQMRTSVHNTVCRWRQPPSIAHRPTFGSIRADVEAAIQTPEYD